MNNYYEPYKEGALDTVHIATSQTYLCEKLVDLGYEVRVISRKLKGTKSYTKRNNVDIYRTLFFDKVFIRFISWCLTASIKLLSLEFKKKSSVIICWDWTTVFPAVLSSRLFKIPIILCVRGAFGSFLTKNRLISNLYKISEKIAFMNSKIIVFPSKWTKNTLGFKMNKQSIILHHGVDLDKFNIRNKPIFKSKKVIIAFIGRLGKEKGVDVLLKAAKKCGLDLKLLIIGDGKERAQLEAMAKQLRLDVNFTGFVEHNLLPKYLAACDIIVLPSYTEGFSSVILEGMAMGKVVIATTVGGAPETISNWKTGVLFAPGDVEGLSKILRVLILNKKLRKKIGKNAHKFIEKKYDWGIIIKKWENLLIDITKGEKYG